MSPDYSPNDEDDEGRAEGDTEALAMSDWISKPDWTVC